jgi:SAM-dependent methyltransferase
VNRLAGNPGAGMIQVLAVDDGNPACWMANKEGRLYSWKEYWAGVAKSYGWADADGFSAVLHPDAPAWFNATIDQLQEERWHWGLQRCRLAENSQVLDVGCGTGRWLRRYLRENVRPVGLDATQDMIRRAADKGSLCPLLVSRAQSLPFPEGTFDLVSAVTVIQHIPPADQREAIREMARVLRPGGHLLLLDLIRGEGPHIFPKRPRGWIEEAGSTGLSLVSWTGQEYLFFDRAFVNIVQTLRKLTGNWSGAILPARASNSAEAAQPQSGGRALYWALRKITCKLSAWSEPLARKGCPGEWATHGVFVFQKSREANEKFPSSLAEPLP